jgi:hypothetical protein
MKKLLMICVASVMSMLSYAGYGDTQWGMSPAQVVEVEKDRAKMVEPIKYANGIGKAQINNISIASGDYTVTFIFDGNDRLVQTNLISNEKKSAGIADSRFKSLHQLLTQKYGEPSFKNSESATWKTGDTTIELRKTIIPGIMAQTSVRYIPNSKIEADTANL